MESSNQNQWLWSPHVHATASPCLPLLAPCHKIAPAKSPPKSPSVSPSNLLLASPSVLLFEGLETYQHLSCGSVSFPNKYWTWQWKAAMVATCNQVLSPLFAPAYFDSSFLAIFPALVSFLRACCSLIHLIQFFFISLCTHLIYHPSFTIILWWIVINSKRCHKKL